MVDLKNGWLRVDLLILALRNTPNLKRTSLIELQNLKLALPTSMKFTRQHSTSLKRHLTGKFQMQEGRNDSTVRCPNQEKVFVPVTSLAPKTCLLPNYLTKTAPLSLTRSLPRSFKLKESTQPCLLSIHVAPELLPVSSIWASKSWEQKKARFTTDRGRNT